MTVAEQLEDSNPTNQEKKAGRRRWLLPSIVFGVLAFAVLIYYGIGYLLVHQVRSLYLEEDCVSLLLLAESVERFYPQRIAPFSQPAREQAAECRMYKEAEAFHTQESWAAAFQAYKKYQTTYTNGIFAKEARELAADSLLAWTVEQRGTQDYEGAVNNLILLLDDYGDTPSAPKAKELLPEVYLEWGERCRDQNEFSKAETVYQSLESWATQKGQKTYITRARLELAQTYFSWGKNLQKENNFDLAKTKFEDAISTDPNSSSANSITAQTRAHLPSFHRAWGETLILHGNYSEAIGHYRTSVELAAPEDIESAKIELAQAYLQWASALRKKEDFNQALDKIELAHASSDADESRTSADAERSNTLDLFSKSKGSQAKKIISDVTKTICEQGKPAKVPPILGVLDEKRLTISGVDMNWSSSLIAQAPGNLRFVTCIKVNEKKMQTCPYSLHGYFWEFPTHEIIRIRYTWDISIFRAVDGFRATGRTFYGSDPEGCPRTHSFPFLEFAHYHYGQKPSMDSIEAWLASLLR